MALLTGWASFLVTLLTLTSVYVLLTVGLNIHFGYTGLLNFGHVAFFGAGAYTAAILTVLPPAQRVGANYMLGFNLPMPAGFVISLALAAAAGGILAVLVGISSIRLSSHHLAIATFALAGIFGDVLLNEVWLTNGAFGFDSVPQPGLENLGSDLWQITYLVTSVLILGAVMVVVIRLVDSPFGRLLKGIRENEHAANMLGKDTNLVKLKSFGLGGAFAGLAGGIYAHYLGLVSPEQFTPALTFTIWTAMLLGGAASRAGPIFGGLLLIAFENVTRFLPTIYDSTLDLFPELVANLFQALIEPLPNHPSFIPNLRFAIVGILLVLVIRYKPEGLFGDREEVTALGEEEEV